MKKVDTRMKVNNLWILVKLISCHSKATILQIISHKYQLTINILHKWIELNFSALWLMISWHGNIIENTYLKLLLEGYIMENMPYIESIHLTKSLFYIHLLLYNFITMTSKWARWRLISPASGLLTQLFIQDADQRKHQSSASVASVKEIHQWPVNSLHKGPGTRRMFPFDDIIMLLYTCLGECL